MTKPANDHVPLILAAEAIAQSAEPLVGELTLTTDRGEVVFALTKEAAEALIEELETFLDTEQ